MPSPSRPGEPAAARLFHDGPLAPGEALTLDDAAAHHAMRVLRLRAGDPVELFNGDGRRYRARLLRADARRAAAEVESVSDGDTESRLQVALAQAVPGSDKMDWVVEKAVELGATAVQPLLSRRCVVRLDAERAVRRLEHWRRIAIAACMQCGRDRLPRIAAPVPYAEWVCGEPADGSAARLLLSPHRGNPLSTVEQPRATVWVLAGPEGGLTDEEESLAIGRGWQPVRLGPRVMRAETAGLAALAALQARFGDF
jgi:16S rRNA (uracil1498-N3)-methyltransferase